METPEDLWATCSSVLISLPRRRSIPMFRWSFLYFHLCPLPLVQSLDAAEKSLALSMPYQAVTHIGEITPEPSLLQARQSQISQPLLDCQMLQSPNHLCGPSLDSLLHAHVCIELGSPKLDPALELCLTRAEQRGRITSLSLLAMLFLMQTRRLLGFCAARVHRWLTVGLASFSARLLCGWSAPQPPSLYWCMGLFLPRCRTSHFPLLNFMRFLYAHFSSLPRSL